MSEDHKNMEVCKYADNKEVALPQTIYHSSLNTINGLSFTSREIDIIACFARGRRPNAIATLLSISVKNVENRIAGIKLKLGCGTQEGIVEFIEKSDKFEDFNKYFSYLLISIEFEKLLKKFSVQISQNTTYSLIYNCKSKQEISFIRLLKKYLKLMGLKLIISGENYEDITSHITTADIKQHHIICCLSKTLVESKPGIFNICNLSQEGLNPIIFITIESEFISIAKETAENQIYHDLTDDKNFYCMFHSILKTITNIAEINEHFYSFNQKYLSSSKSNENMNILNENIPTNIQSNEITSNHKKPLHKSKWFALACSLICFSTSCIWILTNKNNISNVNENHYNLNSISKIEASEICKLPLPCEYFTGRTSILNKMKTILKEKSKIVIVGYQGIGKTQLAYQYAKLNSKVYPGGSYILKADTPQILINSIRSFAIATGTVTENQINQLNEEQIRKITVPLLQNYLKLQDKTLIVLDNVNDYEDIKDLVNIQINKHDIIITSSKKQWGAWDFLELREFEQSNREAENLILRVLKNETSENAKKLANKLGHYPLAIAQAINYLKNNGMITIDKYIMEYDSLFERRKSFLSYQPFEQNNYRKTAFTAFEISKNTLIKEQKEAYFILKLCSYFSHDIIPISIFKNEIKDIHGALEILNKYSLLDFSNIKGEIYVNMHNILRDNIKIQTYENLEDSKIEEKILDLIDSYLHYDFWDNKNIERIRIIMPHVDYILKRITMNKSDTIKIKKIISILGKSGGYHIHCVRDPNEAIRLLENAKKTAQLYDPNNKQLNIIMEDLATSYYYFGEFNKARQEIELVQKRNGTTELSHLIKGHILYNECRYDEAEAAYNTVLKILKETNNPQYLAVTHRSLGLVFYRKSHFSPIEQSKNYIGLSKAHLEKALEMHAISNSENLELAISKHAFGRTAIKLQEFGKTELALSEALRIAKNYCKEDEDHYEALVIKRSFGHFLCLHKKDRFEEGLAYLQQALDGKIRLFKNKPHQAVIGTIEPIIDVYSKNPNNRELRKLIPRILRYLEDWSHAIQIDDSKHINKGLLNDRIYTLKETINRVNSDHNITI